jgi:hypothetical protein
MMLEVVGGGWMDDDEKREEGEKQKRPSGMGRDEVLRTTLERRHTFLCDVQLSRVKSGLRSGRSPVADRVLLLAGKEQDIAKMPAVSAAPHEAWHC